MNATLKKKLEVTFRNYRILRACTPHFAYQATLQAEDKIGTLLPCSVIVQEVEGERTEVAPTDPAASIQAVGNPKHDKSRVRRGKNSGLRQRGIGI